MENRKIIVGFFQRRPRKGFSFSVEYIFEDIRKRLVHEIESRVYRCACYNDGYFTKLINIAQAFFRQGNDVNHITGEVHFLDLLMRKKRVLLTILDCGMMERKRGLAKKLVQWLYLTSPVRKARLVTAISMETKLEVIRYTGCDPNKIFVVPVGVDPAYVPSPKVFNVEKPVILHIGTGPNKNLLRLIEALNHISCHLCIIGKLDETHLQVLKKYHIDYSNAYNISNEELLAQYRNCDILAFVSTFEGFGMPIVEANSVERVVVTSNISSMPEIAGDAACLVDPFEVSSIQGGLLKVIFDAGYRTELIERGRINKLRFDPDRIASDYLNLYKVITEDSL